jgi:lipoprotein-anchoring transpeptidase ErfK/SrfK
LLSVLITEKDGPDCDFLPDGERGLNFALVPVMKRRTGIAVFVAALLAAACSKQEATEAKQKTESATEKVVAKVQDALDISTPMDRRSDPNAAAQREKERFDLRWRELQSFRAQQQAAAQAARQAAQQQRDLKITFVTGKKETFKGIDAKAINAMPVNVPITGDVKGPSVLRAQVLLDRANYSVGVIDGRWGRNSAIAVWWWQAARGMEATGDVDEATFRSIAQAGGNVEPVVSYTLTEDDVKGPFVSIPEDVYEQESLKCLCYQSLREKLAERFHSSEDFLEQLNPGVKFSDLGAGSTINVPNVRAPMTADRPDIAKVVISVAGNSFNGYDSSGALVFHAPTTVGAGFDPSPDETVSVKKIVPEPHFHYNPKLYHEVPDDEPDAHLQPGPNSPVGVVWIALSKPHYGIHGTKDPDSIGYASSHGCIRLTNWDAGDMQHRLREGMEVHFVDPSQKNLPDVAKKAE